MNRIVAIIEKHPFKLLLGIILFSAIYVWINGPSTEKTQTKHKEKIFCYTCNKDLTESSNRILSPAKEGQTYQIWYCTPCWRVAWKEAEDAAEAAGY